MSRPRTLLLLSALAAARVAIAAPVPENNIESVVKIYVVDPYGREISWGSGTMIDAQGDILTNYHVVSLALIRPGYTWRVYPTAGAKSAPVQGAELVTTLAGSAPHLDLALLRATQVRNPDGTFSDFHDYFARRKMHVPHVVFDRHASDYGVGLGEEIHVLGYPGAGGYSITYTKGTVSGFVQSDYGGRSQPWQLKTDARLNHGNSGGAVFDSKENFIGVPSQIHSDRTGEDYMGYVIPLPVVDYFLDQVQGQVQGGLLGAAPAPTPAPETFEHSFEVVQQPVQVGSSPALPGHLVVPPGTGPFPAVLLVHAAGPFDEDESWGPNKVFKDLADGLAGRGIAVMRYSKRTLFSHADGMTIQDEYLDDVDAALSLMRSEPRIDRSRIVVLGFGLGAYLAPWIARDNRKVAGLVLMAPLSRPLIDTWIDQVTQSVAQNPGNAELASQLDGLRAAKERIASPRLERGEKILGQTGAYYLSLRGYDPIATAQKLGRPMLFLEGGRDFMVTPTRDYEPFQRALADRPNATFQLYPDLNHLFISGTGPSTAAELKSPGHVAEKVLEDIASWIDKALPAKSPRGPAGVSKQEVGRIIREHWTEVRDCYEAERFKAPGLSGKVAVAMVIDQAGGVMSAKVSETTLNNPGVESCIVARVRSWRFPPPGNGKPIFVTYPWVFREGSTEASDGPWGEAL